MNFNFSDKMQNASVGLIVQIYERGMGNPNFKHLSLGNPAPEALPIERLEKQTEIAFKENTLLNLQYGPTAGLPALKEQILTRLNKVKGINLDGGDIIIVGGSQQGLDIMPRVFCNDGDVVLCEEFSFSGAIGAMKAMGVKPVGVKMDEGGMMPSALEEAIKANKNAKYIYTIPTFQNPTGITMSKQRRKEIYDIAVKYNMPIYEDDPYGELLYRGEPQPTLKSMDTEGLVIYAGSFSKTLSAGLRVGFIFADKAVISKFTSVKANIDSQTPILNQSIVSNFLKSYDYDEHIANTARIYKEKCEAMLSTIDELLPKSVKRTDPIGGMFVWITFPDNVDVTKLHEDLLAAEVGIVPSLEFAIDKSNPGKSFRLNYSGPSIEDIKEGIRILAEVSKKYC